MTASNICLACHRPLTNEDSRKIGFGPICATKMARSDSGKLLDDQPVLNDVGTLSESGLVCRRLEDGRVACNIPQVVKYHSPTGFEIGYTGSGPADLALNVLHLLLPPGEWKWPSEREWVIPAGGADVSHDAFVLHQDFKFKFIATMNKNGGRIPIEDIQEWIAKKLVERTR